MHWVFLGLKRGELMKQEEVTTVISIGSIVGFALGLVTFFDSFQSLFSQIQENRYLYYGMYRLIAIRLQPILFKWMMSIVSSVLLLFFFMVAV